MPLFGALPMNDPVNHGLPSLDFGAIQKELDSLLIAVPNKIDREWPPALSKNGLAQTMLHTTALVSANTFKSIRFLVAQKPVDPSRRLEYALSTPPLTRTILDSLFNVVFLFEDFTKHSKWYFKSGWRELRQEHERYTATYGGDPDWKDWLKWQQKGLQMVEVLAQITAAEKADPKSIPWWPNPGKMPQHPRVSSATRDYLTYLNDWFYRELSAASHLSLLGLLDRGGHLVNEGDPNQYRFLDKYRSDCVFTTITILLALLSEIEIGLGLGVATRLKYVWSVVASYCGATKNVYERRYATNL
jgi:hypothetical protein